jgi:hypothetical protein
MGSGLTLLEIFVNENLALFPGLLSVSVFHFLEERDNT